MFKPPVKTRAQAFQDAWIKMHQTEWLFPQNFELKDDKGNEHLGPNSSEEYISQFAIRNGNLFMLRAPTPYSLGFLKKYKDNVAMSSHITNGTSIIPYTIFQLDPNGIHVICDWLWDSKDEEFIFPATFLLKNQLDYGKLLADNRDFEIEMKEESSLGFGSKDV